MAESSYVQKAQKKVPYSIKPIADINAYRLEQLAIEREWQIAHQKYQDERRKVAMDIIANGQIRDLPQTMNDYAEREHVMGREGVEIDHPAFASRSYSEIMGRPEPKPETFFNKFIRFCANVWCDAFRGK